MASAPTLSILVPALDEERTLAAVVDELVARLRPAFPFEVIVVDDGSRDGTPKLVEELRGRVPELRALRHPQPRGKGAALRSAIAEARGEVLVIQDADLEYQPRDIPALVQPILDGRADAVYGSRFTGGESRRVLYFWHSLANKLLTLLSNMLTDLNLTDMEVCYKVFRRSVLERIRIEEDRFGFEPEITAKVAKLGCRIFEVGISYSGRTYDEGKKIGWRDGMRAVWCILKYNLLR